MARQIIVTLAEGIAAVGDIIAAWDEYPELVALGKLREHAPGEPAPAEWGGVVPTLVLDVRLGITRDAAAAAVKSLFKKKIAQGKALQIDADVKSNDLVALSVHP